MSMEPEHAVVAEAEWIEARKALLVKEKEMTRLRDAISAQRRQLPWRKVEKLYSLVTPNGSKTLADLFGGRSQLIVKHFMMSPGWKEGCVGCSFECDHVEGALPHLQQHNVTVSVLISRFLEARVCRWQPWHISALAWSGLLGGTAAVWRQLRDSSVSAKTPQP